MKKLILILIVFNLLNLLNAQETIDITYIANEGFLLKSNTTGILIDPLFNSSFGEYEVPSAPLREDIIRGIPPFNKINLFLVTHRHGDHFYAPYVTDFLHNHSETNFMASGQITSELINDSVIGSKVKTINLKTGEAMDTTIGSVSLKIFRMKHLGDSLGLRTECLTYLINLNGFKILHIGDAPIDYNKSYYERLSEDMENIDILFLEYFNLNDYTKQYIQEIMKPKYIIAMHIPPKDIETEAEKFLKFYSNGFVFRKPMETKTFKKIM